MATFSYQDIIDRARTYVDDDHDDTKGWIKPARWLRMAFVEHQLQYKKWLRMGLIAPNYSETEFDGEGITVNGVLCTIGVAEKLGDTEYRIIPWLQDTLGRAPFLSSRDTSRAYAWSATGPGDSLTYGVHPAGADGTFAVRFIPVMSAPATAAETFECPDGADERLVLGLARRAHVKDSSASALLQRLIDEHDAELNFQAMGRVNDSSPRVRSTPRQPYSRLGFTSDPSMYRYH